MKEEKNGKENKSMERKKKRMERRETDMERSNFTVLA